MAYVDCMGLCEVLNQVLKIFPRFSQPTKSDVLLILFTVQWDSQRIYSLNFAVWNATNFFSRNPDFSPSPAPMYLSVFVSQSEP